MAVIIKDTMLDRHWGREIIQQVDVSEMLSHKVFVEITVEIFPGEKNYKGIADVSFG